MKTKPESTLKQHYQIISDWSIVKNHRQYDDCSQVIHIEDQAGEGYFEKYDFNSLNLARLNCRFQKQYTLQNSQSLQGYWIFIILQGEYEISTSQVDESKYLKAPCILLLKGNMGEMTAQIASDMLIQSFYIEFSQSYFEKLQEQQHNNPNYGDSVLSHFVNLDQPYCFIPLTLSTNITNSRSDICMDNLSNEISKKSINSECNLISAQIMHKSWQLYRTPMVTDELSLMTLQGKTFSYVSELLMQSYSKLFRVNLDVSNGVMNQSSNDMSHSPQDYDNSSSTSLFESKEDKYLLHAIQAKLLIDQFYDRAWTIRQLANKVHTNECYLKRDFKNLTGMTIAKYRKQVRMQKAVMLLDKKLKTVDIANQLGFNSHDYFLKSFKQYYGCFPAEYIGR